MRSSHPAEMAERYRFEPAVSHLGGEMGVRTVRMPLGQHGGERDDAAVTPTRPHLESRRRPAARERAVNSGFKVVGVMWPLPTTTRASRRMVRQWNRRRKQR